MQPWKYTDHVYLTDTNADLYLNSLFFTYINGGAEPFGRFVVIIAEVYSAVATKFFQVVNEWQPRGLLFVFVTIVLYSYKQTLLQLPCRKNR